MRSALHALLHRLALAAVFALALVPTLGRFEQACEGASHETWGAMCTAAGLEVADPVLSLADAAPTAATHRHAGHAAPQHAGHAAPRHTGHAAPQHAGHAAPKAPMPSPHHGDGEDCPYCPLLQGLLTPGAVTAGPAIAPAPAAPPVPFAEARFDTPHPTGLGSRGPPIA